MTYGCHNRPRPYKGKLYRAQDGYRLTPVGRVPYFIRVKHIMTTDCQYDKRATDNKCSGCKWAKDVE